MSTYTTSASAVLDTGQHKTTWTSASTGFGPTSFGPFAISTYDTSHGIFGLFNKDSSRPDSGGAMYLLVDFSPPLLLRFRLILLTIPVLRRMDIILPLKDRTLRILMRGFIR